MSRAQKVGRRAGVFVAVGAAILWFSLPVVSAKVASAISQGFVANEDISVGTLVSLSQDNAEGTVEPANSNNGARLIGAASKSSLIELSNGSSRDLQVAISGSSPVLVSNINGEVKRGDKIAPSPISGIGMKATESTQVLGTAEEDFVSAEQVSERVVTDKKGEQRTIKVGLLSTQVNVAYYQKPDDKDSFLPAFLLTFASNIVGRDVAPFRVLIALVLLVAGFGGVAVLLYSSVRSSIISIGRNPLSADAVHKGVFEIAGIAFGVLLLTVIAVYLVLVI